MSLTQQIEEDITKAMKTRDQEKLDALRMVRAAFKNEQIALGHELAEDEAQKVLGRLVKQRQEAADQYRQGDRAEAAAKEEREAQLIQGYLPQQLSDDELTQLVADAIQTTGAASATDFGKVMGAVMPTVAGRADGNRVSKAVKDQLSK